MRCSKTVLAAAMIGVCGFGLPEGKVPAQTRDAGLVRQLQEFDSQIAPPDSEQAKSFAAMIQQDARNRIREANQRETRMWQQVKTRADWEKMRDSRIQALRQSLGHYPPAPTDLKIRITSTRSGEGYRIRNLAYESRPGLVVTANLYEPEKPGRSMPGILIIHSHHNPKTQAELQDMGMTWARLGCLVLIPDQLGHGERRQHPFRDASTYPQSFRVGRQDYYFRYNTGMQLHLIGDSLAGWMAWDMMRGVDLLLSRPGIDKERIILLGSVAGGGDPAGVTAAIDSRITAVAPFNFGGPQPETIFPLPANAEDAFNYAGGGSWESTRNLRLSARDGIMPWVIVGSVAPRRLIYGHEFAWDRERDPVWARFEKIYGFYGTADRLAAAAGKGKLSGKPPESTHCNNIGPEHRKPIYPALRQWFDMPIPAEEARDRRPPEDLQCLTPEIKARPLHELAGELGSSLAASARAQSQALAPEARRKRLRQEWDRLLGGVEPGKEIKVVSRDPKGVGQVQGERILLEVEPGISVPMLLLLPQKQTGVRPGIVVGFSQAGKKEMLKNRAELIHDLLQGKVAVCLPDLRGTGETRLPGDSRGRQSSSTSVSASELMLGRTLVGLRLRDLRGVLRYLRGRDDLDASRIALWGDSFAAPNGADRPMVVPLDADKLPASSEPLGGLLALLGGLFEDDVRAIHARGGLSGYRSVLDSQAVWLPHDAIVPGALMTGDLCDVAGALAPRSVRLEALVDGRNQLEADESLKRTYAPAAASYREHRADARLRITAKADETSGTARWMLAEIGGK